MPTSQVEESGVVEEGPGVQQILPTSCRGEMDAGEEEMQTGGKSETLIMEHDEASWNKRDPSVGLMQGREAHIGHT